MVYMPANDDNDDDDEDNDNVGGFACLLEYCKADYSGPPWKFACVLIFLQISAREKFGAGGSFFLVRALVKSSDISAHGFWQLEKAAVTSLQR